jgi:hypothetical protein
MRSTTSRAWPLRARKGFHRSHNHGTERDQIARADMSQRTTVVGLVLFRPMMPESNLVLIIEPLLIELCQGSIENPLSEAPAYRLRVCLINFAGARIFVVGAKMRMIENHATPDLEKIVDLVDKNVVRESQIDDIFFGKPSRLLQRFPCLETHRRFRDFVGVVGVAGKIAMCPNLLVSFRLAETYCFCLVNAHIRAKLRSCAANRCVSMIQKGHGGEPILTRRSS